MQFKRTIPLFAGLLLFAFLWTQGPAKAAPADDLIITGVIDGPLSGGIPKAIELYVVNDIPDLSIYGLGSANNGGGSDSEEFSFPANSATAGQFIYVASESTGFNSFFGFTPDYTSGAANINGDDAIELFTSGLVTDIFGDINTDGTGEPWEYLDGWAYRNDNTGPDGSTFVLGNWTFSGPNALDGETTNASAATPFPIGTYSQAIVDTPPQVNSTNPADTATIVPVNTTITVTFSEGVDATASAFSLDCPNGSPVTFSSSPTLPGSGSSFTLTPDSDLPNSTTCTVIVTATEITDQDGTVDQMAADHTFSFTTENPGGVIYIHDVQGSGSSVAIAGTVTVEGVVVGDYQGSAELSGFFLQEENTDADANPATSEGIFVYCDTCATAVSEGQIVSVTGTAEEFFDNSQIDVTDPGGSVTVTNAGDNSGLVTTTPVSLPVSTVTDFEALEGMLTTFSQELTVTEHYNLGRYGNVLLSSGGRLMNPTQVAAPGAPATAVNDANLLNQILLDDASETQNPDPIVYPTPALSASNTLRTGNTVAGLTGILTYAHSAYRVQPTITPSFVSTNPRTATPDSVGGTLKVASFNVLNYFNGDGAGGGFPTARGADSATEFTRQRTKIIAAITTLNADVIGLMEIENDGYGSTSAIQDLVNGLNAATAPGTYAFIDPGVSQIGSDAIAVGLLYKPGSVTPSGTAVILDSTVDPTFLDTKNRPVLAQTFSASGEQFTVAVNHLKSKGSPCDDVGDPDALDGQGNCNVTRTNAAIALANWLATDPTTSGDSDFLILGDLNSYAREDPIVALKDQNYTDLYASFQPGSYSYVFGGQFGTLDYAMSSPALTPQVTGATVWHINADEPHALDYNEEYKSAGQLVSLYAADSYRASDHDPVMVGLNLDATAVADFSDLDSVYDTAWHTGSGEVRLGPGWDADSTHQLGDDNGTDDGVSHFTGTWQPGPNGGSLDITVTDVSHGNDGCLYAWIDWNDDSIFDNSLAADNLEYIIRAETGGTGNYAFEVPANEFLPPGTPNSNPNQVYNLRVRLYGVCSSGPTGAGIGGEVEDWVVQFSPTAVTLQSIHAASQNNVWLPVLLAAFVMLLLGGLLVWRNGRSCRQN